MKHKNTSVGRFIIQILIRLYQKTLSLDHSFFKYFFPYGYCRFHPTCSEYAVQAIDKYGAIKGLYKSIFRLIRCHPWSRGGYDPVK